MNSQTSERLAARQGEVPVQQAVALSDEQIYKLARTIYGGKCHQLIWETDRDYAAALDMDKSSRWSAQEIRAEQTLSFARALLAAAHAEPAQQPVAWRYRVKLNGGVWSDWRHIGHEPSAPREADFEFEPLYASPLAQPVNEELVEAAEYALQVIEASTGYRLGSPAAESAVARLVKALAKATGERAGQAALPKANSDYSVVGASSEINKTALPGSTE